MKEDRDLSFDAFRGLAIIAVVAIHASNISSQMRSSTGEWNFSFVAYRQLLNFAVPAFVFISGYWMSKKPIESLEDYKHFLIRRLSRILVPYLLWSSAYIIYGALKTHKIDISQTVITLMTGRAPGPYYYWFVIIIAQFYIITPLLQYLNRWRFGLTLIIILNALALLSRYISRLYLNFWIPSALAFYSWIIFFQIGLLAGNSGGNIGGTRHLRLFILPVILVSLLVSQIEAIIILSKYGDSSVAFSPLKFSSFLYSVCVILGFLFMRTRLRHWPKLLVTTGHYSFGIYLIHVSILRQAVDILQRFSAIVSFQPLYQLVLVVVTTSICFGIISIARKLLPASFCSRVLGF
jgi:surface polysaccharide O-acyltransferase-like enzyme